MSSVPQNVIEHKVVLNLAAELGNVFRACKGNPPAIPRINIVPVTMRHCKDRLS